MRASFVFAITLLAASLVSAAEIPALERLMQGNARYVKDTLEHPNRTPERREAVLANQEPFAIIVGCADSRVAPEILFDQGVGDLFVVRVAGNVIGPLEQESVEFAAVNLHSRVIVVLGHARCGAVQAVAQGNAQNIPAIAKLIEPAVEEEKKKAPDDLLKAVIQANAQRMQKHLLDSPALNKLVSEKKLEVYAGYYDLETGAVEILR